MPSKNIDLSLPEGQKSGFMIVRKMPGLLEEYKYKNEYKIGAGDYLGTLRNAFEFLKTENYRGIDREPISPVEEDRREREIAASVAFLELIEEEDRGEWDFNEAYHGYNKELIHTMPDAKKIFAALLFPDEYEVIKVARDNHRKRNHLCLGYDIGQWSGDHFSLIHDCAVRPRWHPPAPEDVEEVAGYFRKLNRHLLFEEIHDAEEFRTFYLSKRWAEDEFYDGEFCIIEISEYN